MNTDQEGEDVLNEGEREPGRTSDNLQQENPGGVGNTQGRRIHTEEAKHALGKENTDSQ